MSNSNCTAVVTSPFNTLALQLIKKMTSPVCSEDYDAAETFAAALMDQVDNESVNNMVDVQKDMLSRFEKTNEMLINFNILSGNRFAITSQQYRRHTQLMFEMKRDLDSIFKRIRVIKDKLGKSYPESFKVCGSSAPIPEDDEEVEDTVAIETGNQAQNSKGTSNSKNVAIATGGNNLAEDIVSEMFVKSSTEESVAKNGPNTSEDGSQKKIHHQQKIG